MATRYRLILDLDDGGLRALSAAGSRLAIAKTAGVFPPNAVWLACDPVRHTAIAWDEVYGVYGASVPARDGAQIHILGMRYPAADRAVHPFRDDRFTAPAASDRIPPGHYGVDNRAPFAVTFGLVQAATINEASVRSPVNASTVAPGFGASFIAVTTLYVWAGPVAESGSTTGRLPARATHVFFTPDAPTKRLRYDTAGPGFVLVRSNEDRWLGE